MTCPPNAKQLYDAALKAYHELMVGGAVVEVADQAGNRMRYTAANRSALYSYIQQLAPCVPGAVPPCVSGEFQPARFFF